MIQSFFSNIYNVSYHKKILTVTLAAERHAGKEWVKKERERERERERKRERYRDRERERKLKERRLLNVCIYICFL